MKWKSRFVDFELQFKKLYRISSIQTWNVSRTKMSCLVHCFNFVNLSSFSLYLCWYAQSLNFKLERKCFSSESPKWHLMDFNRYFWNEFQVSASILVTLKFTPMQQRKIMPTGTECFSLHCSTMCNIIWICRFFALFTSKVLYLPEQSLNTCTEIVTKCHGLEWSCSKGRMW